MYSRSQPASINSHLCTNGNCSESISTPFSSNTLLIASASPHTFQVVSLTQTLKSKEEFEKVKQAINRAWKKGVRDKGELEEVGLNAMERITHLRQAGHELRYPPGRNRLLQYCNRYYNGP